MRNIIIISIFFSLILFSCKRKTEPTQTIESIPQVDVPSFNQDSAYSFINKQLSFGPRVIGTNAHKQCAEYLSEKLKSYNANVIKQNGIVRTHEGKTLNITNIIASYNKNAPYRIILCAHWDSRPFADKDPNPQNHTKPVPAANDGASGVAVLLEIARIIQDSSFKTGIDIIFFDAEDYGSYSYDDSWCLGSKYWANNPHTPDYSARYAILLDMVGAKNAIFPYEEFSRYYASDILNKVWNIAAYSGYSDYFVKYNVGSITDDHLIINKILKIPAIDIIHYDMNSETGFFPQWHTINDDINVIDKATLKAVGQTILEVIYREK